MEALVKFSAGRTSLLLGGIAAIVAGVSMVMSTSASPSGTAATSTTAISLPDVVQATHELSPQTHPCSLVTVDDLLAALKRAHIENYTFYPAKSSQPKDSPTLIRTCTYDSNSQDTVSFDVAVQYDSTPSGPLWQHITAQHAPNDATAAPLVRGRCTGAYAIGDDAYYTDSTVTFHRGVTVVEVSRTGGWQSPNRITGPEGDVWQIAKTADTKLIGQ